MTLRFSEYGYSTGPDQEIPLDTIVLPLKDGGVDLSVNASDLPPGMSPDAVDVRLDSGGVSSDRDFSPLGPASDNLDDSQILRIFTFQQSNLNTKLIRMRSTGWDRWDGTTWKTLLGTFSGTVNDMWSATIYADLLIGANGIDKLQSWDGNDAHSVQNLSADAPVAKYITRIGNRILAARINPGTGVDPNAVAWCADGDAGNWTDPNLGAGAASIFPEGTSESANIITGLSTLAQSGILYRQRSIGLAQLTGISIAPFRFTSIIFDHGVDSPLTIASAGPAVGDIYLGHDYLVRLFDGTSTPVPIGLPIMSDLKATISDLSLCVGVVDTNRMEYWLGVPTDDTGLPTRWWVFSIYQYIRTQRLVWRRKTIPFTVRTVGFGQIPSSTDPTINSVTAIINTVNKRINSFANTAGPLRLLVGDISGQVSFIDEDVPFAGGSWSSGVLSKPDIEITVEWITLIYRARTAGSVEVSLSTDGGSTWQSPQVYVLVPRGSGVGRATMDFRITGINFQVRIRPLSGTFTISEVQCVVNTLGIGFNR